jgi:DUF1016 N-terminal domain
MQTLYPLIAQIITDTRAKAYQAVNSAMVQAYWHIGQKIVEEEQKGKYRAEYGTGLLKYLSEKLKADFGTGFNVRNLAYMKQFYTSYPILHAVRAELSWTHYCLLLKVQNEKAREFYLSETIDNQWSTRSLERQINTFYYERLLTSQDRKPVRKVGKTAN